MAPSRPFVDYLVYFAPVIGTAAIAQGIYAQFDPGSIAHIFGVPLSKTSSDLNKADIQTAISSTTISDRSVAEAYIKALAGRNLAMGTLVNVFFWTHNCRALATTLFCSTLAAAVDAAVCGAAGQANTAWSHLFGVVHLSVTGWAAWNYRK